MQKACRVAILGGDARMAYAASYLIKKGYPVRTWGMGATLSSIPKASVADEWGEAIKGADALVLPLPVSGDGLRLFAPLLTEEQSPRLSALFEAFSGEVVLGGRLERMLSKEALKSSFFVYDYFDAETLQLKNALLTAEGAISIAMNLLPVSLQDLEVAVVGYGRIGSLIVGRLLSLGARVSVLARKEEALTLVKLSGGIPILLEEGKEEEAIASLSGSCRVLFNTVPARVLRAEALLSQCPDCILIELASVPGGIDHENAKTLGLPVVLGSALPGKYAPESAGIAIGEEIVRVLSRR